MDASSAFKDSLPTSPETLLDKLTSLDISFTTHTHPPLRTVEDAKAFRGDLPGDLPGAHIKNLYLRDRKKRNFLVVAQEDRQIDLKSLGGRSDLTDCHLAVPTGYLKCSGCARARSARLP